MAFSLVARQRLGAGDSEAAIMALQRSLQNDPNHAPTYFQLGMALKTHGLCPWPSGCCALISASEKTRSACSAPSRSSAAWGSSRRGHRTRSCASPPISAPRSAARLSPGQIRGFQQDGAQPDGVMPRGRAEDTQIQSTSGMESPLMPEHYIAIYKDDRTLSGGSGAG